MILPHQTSLEGYQPNQNKETSNTKNEKRSSKGVQARVVLKYEDYKKAVYDSEIMNDKMDTKCPGLYIVVQMLLH